MIVREKLRHWAPPYTESMEAPFLEAVLETLFPAQAGGALHMYSLSPRLADVGLATPPLQDSPP